MRDEVVVDTLRKLIVEEVYTESTQQRIVTSEGEESRWLFDFRRVIMRPAVIDLIATQFAAKFSKVSDYQIGCLEVAGIPLAVGLSYYFHQQGEVVNSFFIRKSRKKSGLLQMVEGTLTDQPVILVDDIINSGNSFIRQVEVLESLGKKVVAVFVVLRFRDEAYYEYFREKQIQVISLFTLNDFASQLPVTNLTRKETVPVPRPYTIDWCFRSEGANYFYVVPKSAPALDAERVYFGSDSGFFWALNQTDGSIAWRYKVGFHAKGKSIFSSPLVIDEMVYFGAYDGNFYALDTKTGQRRWVFMEADWIGSSPGYAPKRSLLFVGLEFGLLQKQGGIAALDCKTGKKVWEYKTEQYVHASPVYGDKRDVVVCGANNGVVYGLRGKDGRLLWEFATDGEVKAAAAFSEDGKIVFIGSFDGNLYALDAKTGQLRFAFKTQAAIYSTPLVYRNKVYVSSLDKRIYCLDVATGAVLWEFATAGRVFASPAEVAGSILVGSNDGRLYQLEADTGRLTAQHQVTERITNKVAYNSTDKTIFLPTFANEIYKLSQPEDHD